MTEKLLQWHPAFFAGIQIEFGPIKKKRNTDTKEKYRKDI